MSGKRACDEAIPMSQQQAKDGTIEHCVIDIAPSQYAVAIVPPRHHTIASLQRLCHRGNVIVPSIHRRCIIASSLSHYHIIALSTKTLDGAITRQWTKWPQTDRKLLVLHTCTQGLLHPVTLTCYDSTSQHDDFKRL